MLDAIGIASVDDLFADVPESLRAQARLDLPDGLPEQEVRRRLAALSQANGGAPASSAPAATRTSAPPWSTT
jgi:glycine dehydrogenase subunit 1